ncbi:hypothetical protein CLU79DRAFT_773773 [Phycomyces nitens]|nr:hypothetical protein CLU79DRAFT_773773 [Phycomyces nitens]
MPNTPLISKASMPETDSANVSKNAMSNHHRIKQNIQNLRDRLSNLAKVLNYTSNQEDNDYQKTIHISISEAQHDLAILESIEARLNNNLIRSYPTESGSLSPAQTPSQPITHLAHEEGEVHFSIDDCLDRFEAMASANGQSLDVCWSTLLPLAITKEQLPVLNTFLNHDPQLPWSIVRSTLVRMYSINTARRQVLLTMKLMNMSMDKDESVVAYTERFQKVRREAGAPDNLMTYILYIRSLPTEVAHQVRLAQINLSTEEKCSVDQITTIARMLHNNDLIVPDTFHNEPASTTQGKHCAPLHCSTNRRNIENDKDEAHNSIDLSKECRLGGSALCTVQSGKVTKPSSPRIHGSRAGSPKMCLRNSQLQGHICDREKLQPHLPLRSFHNDFADGSAAFDLRGGSLHDDDVTMNGTYTAPSG